jgi:hypothetical protein
MVEGERQFDEDRQLYFTELLPGPAKVATNVPPGPAKVDVLKTRFENFEDLWHPQDATIFVRTLKDIEE